MTPILIMLLVFHQQRLWGNRPIVRVSYQDGWKSCARGEWCGGLPPAVYRLQGSRCWCFGILDDDGP